MVSYNKDGQAYVMYLATSGKNKYEDLHVKALPIQYHKRIDCVLHVRITYT